VSHKAFKLRLEPTPEQTVLLNKTFGCVRSIWNQRVDGFNNWNPGTETVEPTIKELKVIYPWLAEVPYNALEQKLNDWRSFKSQFFNKKRKKKLGRPSFRSRRGRQSFRLSINGFSFKDNQVVVSKIGKLNLVGYDLSILPLDTCKSITISKDPSGKCFCSILLEVNIQPKPLTGQMVGIDLGIKDLYILSDGQVVENPKWYHENQVVLKKAQQRLSRKVRGSRRHEKQRIKVAKVLEKIKNKRNYFLHNISSSLVTNYDLICLEDLNVSGMVKNHCLAKAIQNASWSSFVSMLAYKCDWYGKTLVKVDRFFPSSKTCSSCGFKMDKMPLDVREWTCPSCGSRHHRDHNAAKNILQEGFRILTGQEFASFPKLASAEYVEYRRGEVISLFDEHHHLASFVKRLEVI